MTSKEAVRATRPTVLCPHSYKNACTRKKNFRLTELIAAGSSSPREARPAGNGLAQLLQVLGEGTVGLLPRLWELSAIHSTMIHFQA